MNTTAEAKPKTKKPARKAPVKKSATRKTPAKKTARKSVPDTQIQGKASAGRKAAAIPPALSKEAALLRSQVLSALEALKARDVREIDIRAKASYADLLIIASGTSTRHVKSIADEVVKFVKKAGMMPLGIEGEKEAEWVLVDLGDVVVHVMLPRIREFYGLERLWSVGGDHADPTP